MLKIRVKRVSADLAPERPVIGWLCGGLSPPGMLSPM
jgi:hypothetical protein